MTCRSPRGALRFRCAFDAAQLHACRARYTQPLAAGRHVFRARALDRAGNRSPIRLIPYSQAYAAGFEDMARRVPDLTKVGRVIGYRPTRDLDQILEDVLADVTAGLGDSRA